MKKNYRFFKGFLSGWAFMLLIGAAALAMRTKIPGSASDNTDEEAAVTQEHVNKLAELEMMIDAYNLEEADKKKMTDYMYKGLIAGLEDPYAAYYTEEELSSVQQSLEGSYKGIGVLMTQNYETNEIKVLRCYEGAPAENSGLMPDDILLKINGQDTAEMSLNEVVSIIQQGEEDMISLTVAREGEKEPLTFSMEREKVEVPTVNAQMLEDEIGYIQITEFDSVTVSQFGNALEELEEEGMEKLIVDVRNNPGGMLTSVCDILDQMLPEGLMVYTEDKEGNRSEYSSDEEHQFTKPLAVLVNENSASASEIFAGAIQDYGLGTIVGTTTYGKGIVQTTYSLEDGSALKLTTAKYYTPDGNDIHEKGITPDVAVEAAESVQTPGATEKETDIQLEKAIEILNEN
ncbi:MAG: S41 family peptidase [Eubacteriales bacterium]|nr:S41 family peptidase [Eubacteriales bacterium]